jgi:hypothetical protein
MLGETPVVSNRDGKEGRTMKRRGLVLGRRFLAFGAAAVLALSLAGDRGRAATVPAGVNGQDPLEVLELKVRPNVIVVLDSSGSMTNIVPEGFNTNSGDHPRSKLYQAKQVVKQLVQLNQDKVSFQFGTYTQYTMSMNNLNAGDNRFQYVVSGQDASFMNTSSTELILRGALGDSLGRGLQPWQIIYPQQTTPLAPGWSTTGWNTLYYQETISGTTYTCIAQLPTGPGPNGEKFYAQGGKTATGNPDIAGSLAADLKAAINNPTGCSRPSGTQNTYDVTYNTGNGQFTFTRTGGSNNWRPLWPANAGRPNNIAGALNVSSNPSSGSGPFTTGSALTLLYRQTGTGNSGTGLSTRWTFTESINSTNVNFYQLRAGRLWNGEVIRVNPSGETCGMDFATAATKTDPPSVTLQQADASCVVGTNTAVFTYGGADWGGNSRSCNGFRSKSDLIPCDLQSPPAPLQIAQNLPYLDDELPFAANGDPADWDGDGSSDYIETMNGTWAVQTIKVAPSAKADGSTPIANSLIDIKGTANPTDTSCITNPSPTGTAPNLYDLNSVTGNTGTCVERGFTKLWNTGQAGSTAMAGPPPWQLDAIKNHLDPKEKTIVLFVTDGDDTCTSRPGTTSASSGDGASRRAAYYAQLLYTRLDATEPASSVQTYVIGFGGAFSGGEPYRLNWIAWGGSGLGQGLTGQPSVDWQNDTSTELSDARALCTTCQDAFVAPDAATLATQLQSIIDQGASEGDFNAQQSITESVFEYVDLAKDLAGNYTFDPSNPATRYTAIVPTRFISSFSLPGFHGQLKAYQNDGSGNTVQKWSAGDRLFTLVSTGMASCNDGAAGECVFSSLPAKIARRIYTTSRNGVYTYTPDDVANTSWTPPERVTLWPTPSNLAPGDYSSQGSLDAALGLPLDSTSNPAGDFASLQTSYKACLGGNLPSVCTSGGSTSMMKAARREAREMILAFMAGAAPVPQGTGVKRTSAGYVLYKAREWVLADSELATAAVVTPPSLSEPDATPYVAEYRLYRDGVGNAPSEIQQGFGLSRPDNDKTTADPGRPLLKPVMTVVYAPANDMLHAFRAGPNCVSGSRTNTCTENGGEELWGFVPYDQLNALGLRLANDPQGRANHVFMLARGVRFADVFVPGATTINIGGLGDQPVNGVWRRILYFGRGIGGKYVTALDVTAPGPYTALSSTTAPPIPVWSRGNPDTYSGALQQNDANLDNDQHDYNLYRRMGETWSIPTVAFVNKGKTNPHYVTARRSDGVDFVLFMGSGYGVYNDHGLEGTTHYTLDALTGDVVAAADVEPVAAANGIDRAVPTQVPYNNALVANSVSFNRSAFESLSAKVFNSNPHPWSYLSTRVYIGDLHGRLWKFLTDSPGTAIPAADLGADQPIGVAVALLGEDKDPGAPDPLTSVPNIFVSSGNERRAQGPCLATGDATPCFRSFALRDDGDDVDGTVGPTTVDDGVTTFAPVIKRFARTFDQGNPEANCGYPTEAVFRGTIQATSAVECDAPLTGSKCEGNILQRVFFGGTRLSLPNTKFAPPTQLACGTGDYPCRSQFDSILYALGVVTGQAAYDLNATGDDAYRIFRDSRIAAIGVEADPDASRGGSSFAADEGLMKGIPKPPPPPGIPPTATTSTPNVVMARVPGEPPPAVRYGSSVCSEQP